MWNWLFYPLVWSSSVSDVYGQAASNLVAGSNLEATVQQILDMGGGSWDRETVIRALRAAYNNPERAVEYLYSVSQFLPSFGYFICPLFTVVSFSAVYSMKLELFLNINCFYFLKLILVYNILSL